MNKKFLLLVNLSLLTFYCYGQVYHKDSEQWMRIYPMSATQFEQNEGIEDAFEFAQSFENLANSMFLPVDNIKYNKDKVAHLNITKYIRTTKWDEIIWEKRDVNNIQFKDNQVLVNGGRVYDSFFSVLNSKGEEEKNYQSWKLIYKRDEVGRVSMAYLYRYNKLVELYRYTYQTGKNFNLITKIEKFSSEGKRIETVKFHYDDADEETLILAMFEDKNEVISMRYDYDSYGNPISIRHSIEDKIYEKEKIKKYTLLYEYSGDKISSCVCRYGEQPDQYKQWDFKNDDKGNWIEMVIPTSGVKYTREIIYK